MRRERRSGTSVIPLPVDEPKTVRETTTSLLRQALRLSASERAALAEEPWPAWNSQTPSLIRSGSRRPRTGSLPIEQASLGPWTPRKSLQSWARPFERQVSDPSPRRACRRLSVLRDQAARAWRILPRCGVGRGAARQDAPQRLPDLGRGYPALPPQTISVRHHLRGGRYRDRHYCRCAPASKARLLARAVILKDERGMTRAENG